MLPYTQNSLTKLEDLLRALGYKVRYEKGSFKSGTCLFQQENILVVNRYSDLEIKIKSMLQVIQQLEINEEIVLQEKQKKLLYALHQMSLEL